jgi:(2R)-ethylmalonyl-CoA mutase
VAAPVVVGGIIPEGDEAMLKESAGVAAVYTPKDFELTRIMSEIADLVASYRGAPAATG